MSGLEMAGLEMAGLKGCEDLVGQRLKFWLALGDHSICRSWKAIDWLNTVDLNFSSQGTERQAPTYVKSYTPGPTDIWSGLSSG